jgi:hypothetical protein
LLNARQVKVLNRLPDRVEGKLTTSKYAKLTQGSQHTAYRDILDLVERGALRKDPGGGRSTSYSLSKGVERKWRKRGTMERPYPNSDSGLARRARRLMAGSALSLPKNPQALQKRDESPPQPRCHDQARAHCPSCEKKIIHRLNADPSGRCPPSRYPFQDTGGLALQTDLRAFHRIPNSTRSTRPK